MAKADTARRQPRPLGRRRALGAPGQDARDDPGARHAAGAGHPVHRLPLPVATARFFSTAEHLDRGAAGLDQHRARGRHDLCHPDRRHRPVGRLDPRGLGHGGGDRVADPGLRACWASRPACSPACSSACVNGVADRLRQAAALHRHAGLADRGARHRAADGQRHHRLQSATCRSPSSATPACSACPGSSIIALLGDRCFVVRPAPHGARRPDLRGRRQPRGGAAVRHQGLGDPAVRLCPLRACSPGSAA